MIRPVQVVIVELGDQRTLRCCQRMVENIPQASLLGNRDRLDRKALLLHPVQLGVVKPFAMEPKNQLDMRLRLRGNSGDDVAKSMRSTSGNEHRDQRHQHRVLSCGSQDLAETCTHGVVSQCGSAHGGADDFTIVIVGRGDAVNVGHQGV